jgi:hypothetical protein
MSVPPLAPDFAGVLSRAATRERIEAGLGVSVSDPADQSERAAEAAASAVMARILAPGTTEAKTEVRARSMDGRGPLSCHGSGPVSTTSSGTAAEAYGVANVLAQPGASLPSATLRRMQAGFAADFSSVRVHQGPAAQEAARLVEARAFTIGHRIVFGAGEYRPDSEVGQHLLAHELAHVVQQSSSTQNRALPIVRSTDAGERAAQTAAQRSTPVLPTDLGSFPGPFIQRQVDAGSSPSGFRPVDNAAAQTEFQKKVAKFKKSGESKDRAEFLAMDEMFAERVAEFGGKRLPGSATYGGKGRQTFVMVLKALDYDGHKIDAKFYNAIIDSSVYNCHSFTMNEEGKTKLQQLTRLARKVPREGGEIAGQSFFDAQDLLDNGIHFAPKEGAGLEIYPRWIVDKEMRARLKDFKELPVGAKVAVGDIAVYSLGGALPHSGKVVAVDKQGKPTMIKSKWGKYALFEHSPAAVPSDYGTPHYYRKK